MLVNIQAPDEFKASRDSVLLKLKSMTNAELKAYIDKDVTSLADVKDILTRLLLLCKTLIGK